MFLRSRGTGPRVEVETLTANSAKPPEGRKNGPSVAMGLIPSVSVGGSTSCKPALQVNLGSEREITSSGDSSDTPVVPSLATIRCATSHFRRVGVEEPQSTTRAVRVMSGRRESRYSLYWMPRARTLTTSPIAPRVRASPSICLGSPSRPNRLCWEVRNQGSIAKPMSTTTAAMIQIGGNHAGTSKWTRKASSKSDEIRAVGARQGNPLAACCC